MMKKDNSKLFAVISLGIAILADILYILYSSVNKKWYWSNWTFRLVVPILVMVIALVGILKREGVLLKTVGIVLMLVSQMCIIVGVDSFACDDGEYMIYMMRFGFYTNVLLAIVFCILAGAAYFSMKKDRYKNIFTIVAYSIIGYRFFTVTDILSEFVYCFKRNFVTNGSEVYLSVLTNVMFIAQVAAICFMIKNDKTDIKQEIIKE